MKQIQFEQKYEAFWQKFEFLLNDLEKRKKDKDSSLLDRYNFPKQYRKICNHFAIAKQRHYSPILTERLHTLVLKGHEQIYRNKTIWFWRLLEFLTALSHAYFASITKYFGWLLHYSICRQSQWGFLVSKIARLFIA